MTSPHGALPVIELGELRRRHRDGTLVVADVLPAESYRAGHIPGALHLPLDGIVERARRIIPELGREIVLYCGSDT